MKNSIAIHSAKERLFGLPIAAGCCLFVVLTCSAVVSQAACRDPEPALIGPHTEKIIAPFQAIVHASTDLKWEDLTHQPGCGAFAEVDDVISAQLRGSSRFWLRLRVNFENNSPDGWLLRLSGSDYDRVCIHMPRANGAYLRQCAGTQIPHRDWPIEHPRMLFPFPPDIVDKPILVEAYTRIRQNPRIELVRAQVLLGREFPGIFASGLFYGVIALITLYSLVTSLTVGDRVYLWYGLHLMTLGAALFGFSGFAYALLGSGFFPSGVWSAAPLALLAATFALGAQFVRRFLDTPRYTPRLDRWLMVLLAAPLPIVIGIVIRPVVAEQAIAIEALSMIFLMALASLKRVRQGFRPAAYLLAAVSAFAVSVTAVALESLGLLVIPGAIVGARSGAAVAALAMLAGMGYRTRELRRQRDAALEEAMAQTRIALHRLNFDEVTGVGSRSRLLAEGAERMAQIARTGGQLAMLVVDLDRFAVLEKTQPHSVVDRILHGISQRVAKVADDGDIVARPSTDSLALLRLFENGDMTKNRLTASAENLREAVAHPVVVGDQEVRPTATIGVAVAPAASTSFEGLQMACHRAVIEGKNQGGNTVVLYRPDVHDNSVSNTLVQTELWRALEDAQIQLHYQPIIDLTSGQLHGYEALVRWIHPTRGTVCPDDFLPQIEGTHLMVELGRRVQELACMELASWKGKLPSQLSLAINVAAIELQQSSFADGLFATIERYGVNPKKIALELTESSLVQNLDQAARILEECRHHGIDTLVDDFGTGYSSLAYVRSLPLAGLKIDRSFIQRLEKSGDDQAIVGTIIQLAHGLSLKVVAEGVENTAQRAFLESAGCDLVQGYLLGRPEPQVFESEH